MNELLNEIKSCKHCEAHLPEGPNPVCIAHENSKILIIGQAPGKKVHLSGIPWDDKSGDNLRDWLGIDAPLFYDPALVAILPMGFCYPGRGKSGDLPPRKECAPLWHSSVVKKLKKVHLTLLIGQYAQAYYLGDQRKRTLTETVKNFEHYLPKYFVLPHPSPRNNIWRKKNPWFEAQVLPSLKSIVSKVLAEH